MYWILARHQTFVFNLWLISLERRFPECGHFEVYSVFNSRNNVVWKIIKKLLQLTVCLFCMTVRISILNLSVPTKQATVILIKVKSWNLYLIMILVCINSYLKSVLRCKFLILDIYHLNTLFLFEQWCEDPWLFF